MASGSDNGSPFTAIDKTGNETGQMGSGDVKGGGRGHDKMNKPNPYGAGPMQGPASVGGKAASGEEDY